MDLNLKCKKIEIDGHDWRKINIEIIDTDLDDVMENIDVNDAINFYNKDVILDTIGIEYVKQYFELEEINQ